MTAKKRPYNGKGDPRCLGDAGLTPDQLVGKETLSDLGERFKANRKPTRPRPGPMGKMQVRCYWYQQALATGLLVPVKQLTISRVVDEVGWVRPEEPASKWIRGWVVWGMEYVEVRKEIGDRYWKTMRLIDREEWDEGKHGKRQPIPRSLNWGKVIAWPGPGP